MGPHRRIHTIRVWLYYRLICSIKTLDRLVGSNAGGPSFAAAPYLYTYRMREVTEGKQRSDGVGASGLWADIGPIDVTVHKQCDKVLFSPVSATAPDNKRVVFKK